MHKEQFYLNCYQTKAKDFILYMIFHYLGRYNVKQVEDLFLQQMKYNTALYS